jgi:hypothetical protein
MYSGPHLTQDGLEFTLDPSSTKTQKGLTFFLVSFSGGHPSTESQLDAVFTTSRTLIKTGLHEGELNWAHSSQPVTMPNYGPTLTYTSGYPSYMTDTNTTATYGILYRGYIYAPENGTYEFSINGDDAMDLHIGGTRVAYWYGGHGFRSDANRNDGSITLTKGWHKFQTRFEEQGGGDGIAVGWLRPSSSTWEIVPGKYYKPLITNLSRKGGFTPKFKHIDSINSSDKKRKKLEFSSSNNYVQIEGGSHTSLQRTVEIILKVDSVPATYTPIATYTRASGGVESGKRIWLGLQSNKFQMHGWGTTDPSSTTSVTDGNYYHCVYAYDQLTKKHYIWVNGQLENNSTNTQGGMSGWSNSSDLSWWLGHDPQASGWASTASSYFDGDIPVFKLYNKILSTQEVQQNYKAYKNRFNLS